MKAGLTVGLLLYVAGTGSSAFADAPDTEPAQAIAQMAPVQELDISPVVGEPDGLSSMMVTDRKSGAVFKVYFDNASVNISRQSIPTLAALYRGIAPLTAVDAAEVAWDAVLFARNADALVLTRKPGVAIWKIDVAPDGALSPDGVKTLYRTLPHEQVHATQDIGHDAMGLPRWFSEGQATWAGLQITERWKPALARDERDRHATSLAAAKRPLALAQWGGLRPKLEAILRQLTPEQRTQFIKDPSSVLLSGAFTFNEKDFAQDESNTLARYGGALALFERIDREAGRTAMLAWFKAVQQAGKKLSNEQLAALALQYTQVNITPALE